MPMQNTTNIVWVIVLLVVVDTSIFAVCDQRSRKNHTISLRCRLTLFLVGFALVLIPAGMVVDFRFPIILVIGALAGFAGLAHSRALDIKRRYMSGKSSKHL